MEPRPILRFRGAIALAWLVAAVALLPLARQVEDPLEGSDGHPDGDRTRAAAPRRPLERVARSVGE